MIRKIPALSFILFFLLGIVHAQVIQSIVPNTGTAGNSLTAHITGQNIQFSGATGSNVSSIYLHDGVNVSVTGTSINVIGTDSVDVNFNFPSGIANGFYNLHLISSGIHYMKPGCFEITGGVDRKLISIIPNQATAGTTLSAQITGTGVQFLTGTGATTDINSIYLNKLSNTINGTSITAVDSVHANVDFNIPANITNGLYDVHLTTYSGYHFLMKDSVEITGGVDRRLLSIAPYQAYRGQTLTAQITGMNVWFLNGTGSGNISSVNLSDGLNTAIGGSGITVLDSNNATVNFTIPFSAPRGLRDLNVYTFPNNWFQLLQSFEITGNVISGNIFFDVDSNGAHNSGDVPKPGLKVLLLPDSIYATSDNQGNFHFAVDTGNYTVQFVPDTGWFLTTTPASYSVNVGFTDVTGLDFGVQPLVDNHDVSVDLSGGVPRCNWNIYYYVYYSNHGTAVEHGAIKLLRDSDLTFNNSIPSPDLISGDTLIWNYTALQPGESRVISVSVHIPTLAGTQLYSNVCLDLQDGSNNVFASQCDSLHQVVTCSFDPNDKSVEPEGVQLPHFVHNNIHLEYMVRFQNTGNDTAYRVVIRDTIDASLDINTLEVIASSHNVETHLMPGHIVEFRFENILLADSIVNELASHGFVKYKIHPKSGLPDPVVVYNTAYIYFDLNAAVATNTVFNTLASVIPGFMEISNSHSPVSVYPNPVSNQSHVLFSNPFKEKFDVRIFDALGRIRFTLETDADHFIISRKELEAGMYFIQLVNKGNHKTLSGRFLIAE